jgi:hypothetical protein
MALPVYYGIAARSINLMASKLGSRDHKREGGILTSSILLSLIFGISLLAISAITINDYMLKRPQHASQRSRRPSWPWAWTVNRGRLRQSIWQNQRAHSISFSTLLGKLRGSVEKAEVPDVEMQRSPPHLHLQAGRLSRSLRTETRSTGTGGPGTNSRGPIVTPSYIQETETDPVSRQANMSNWPGYRDSQHTTSSLSLNHSIRTSPSITLVPARLSVNRIPSPSPTHISGRPNTPPPMYERHHSDGVIYDNFIDVPESARQPPDYEAGEPSPPLPVLLRELL